MDVKVGSRKRRLDVIEPSPEVLAPQECGRQWQTKGLLVQPNGLLVKRSSPAQRQQLEEEISYLLSIKEEIENETNLDLDERLVPIRQMMQQTVKEAELYKKRQERTLSVLYKHECEEADAVFEQSRESLADRMIEEVRELMKKVEDTRDGVVDVGERMTTRLLRSKTKGEMDERGNGHAINSTGRKKRQSTVFRPLQRELHEDDIMTDIQAIRKDNFKKEAARKANTPSKESSSKVMAEPGRLYYSNNLFIKGDKVKVSTPGTAETFVGEVCSINYNEVVLELKDGTRSRVYVAHLRSGRRVVQRQK